MRLTGVPASEGVATGPAFFYRPEDIEPARTTIGRSEVEAELSRFREAVRVTADSLAETAARVRAAGVEEEAAIFEAHVDIARDPELASQTEERIRGLQAAEAALLEVGERYAATLTEMGEEYLAARADDVRDVTRQIAARLMGRVSDAFAGLTEPSIVVARNLVPSETARLPEGMALGFVTAEGSRTSHVAIMARALAIPAVVGVGADLDRASGTTIAALDGASGTVVFDPDAEVLEEFARLRAAQDEERAELMRFRRLEAHTADGRRIEVGANLGSASGAGEALEWGAEGVGLFRTEFLFMERAELPSEDEQYRAYRSVAEAFEGRPVVIRTLDVGGDKGLPGIEFPREDNPFLGWRGIRLSLDTPGVFRPQLRAILRAAAHGNVKVMFPMVTDAGEIVAAREVLAECARELEAEGRAFGSVSVGVMVETPAAALAADRLAEEVDFFSIGTNDLTQYTLAADRGNQRLAHLQRADHPAVLRLVEMTCAAARRAGIWVGVCGEAAGDPALVPVLIALGVTELSMTPRAIPRAKQVISELGAPAAGSGDAIGETRPPAPPG